MQSHHEHRSGFLPNYSPDTSVEVLCAAFKSISSLLSLVCTPPKTTYSHRKKQAYNKAGLESDWSAYRSLKTLPQKMLQSTQPLSPATHAPTLTLIPIATTRDYGLTLKVKNERIWVYQLATDCACLYTKEFRYQT